LGCTLSDDVFPYRADYYPIIGQLLHEMNVAEKVNRVVEADEAQANIDVGTFVCLMIHNLLGDVNIRLYRMQEFFQDKALPLMIPWKPDVNLDEINDDRAARVLDVVWKADPQKVFSVVANQAVRLHVLDTSIIHGDTTSKSFQGTFDNMDGHMLTPLVTYGYSKDHRPDLKQLVFGVGTTADGIPILAEVADGNSSDKTLNGRWVKNLRSVLGKDIQEFLLYVADSSLVTTPNLCLMAKYHIDFISRLPGTFDIEEELKRKAFQEDNWEYIGKVSEDKHAAVYHSCEMSGDIEGKTYRFVVLQSDRKDKRKVKALDRTVQKEREGLKEKVKKLRTRAFACRRDAEIEQEKFFHGCNPRYHLFEWDIEERQEKVKRNKQGRPRKDEEPCFQTWYYLNGEVHLNEEVYEKEQGLCGLFVLVTSLMDREYYSAKSILERYKGQGSVERIFKFIKNPSWVGSFCLKKPGRIAALGYIVLIAAMIYTLWERRVRKALAGEEASPILGLDKKKTKKPTTYALQIVLSSILVLTQKIKGERHIWLPKPLNPNQKRVLKLSGFDEGIYFLGERRVEKKISQSDMGGCGM